jgi:hypothetical protein
MRRQDMIHYCSEPGVLALWDQTFTIKWDSLEVKHKQDWLMFMDFLMEEPTKYTENLISLIKNNFCPQRGKAITLKEKEDYLKSNYNPWLPNKKKVDPPPESVFWYFEDISGLPIFTTNDESGEVSYWGPEYYWEPVIGITRKILIPEKKFVKEVYKSSRKKYLKVRSFKSLPQAWAFILRLM